MMWRLATESLNFIQWLCGGVKLPSDGARNSVLPLRIIFIDVTHNTQRIRFVPKFKIEGCFSRYRIKSLTNVGKA